MGRPRTSNVLKLLHGTAQRNPQRLRDEASVTPRGKPVLPPWIVLSAEAKEIFDWLMEHAIVPGVHARPDGVMLAMLAKEFCIDNKAMNSIEGVGVLMRDKAGQPCTQPYWRVHRDASDKIVKLMNELGISPQGRLRLAPPKAGGPLNVASWDDLDS